MLWLWQTILSCGQHDPRTKTMSSLGWQSQSVLRLHSGSFALWDLSIPTSSLGGTVHQALPPPPPYDPTASAPCTSSPALSAHMLGCPCICFYSLRSSPCLVQSQLSLQLGIFLFVLCEQTHNSIQRGSPRHVTTVDTALHPQLAGLSLQLPMTYGVCLSLTWQLFFHFLWFLIYKTKLTYFSIFPPLGPTPFGALIFRLQRWQGVKDIDTANAVRVRCTEK